MTDRHLDFKVHQPQLEADPGSFRGGVKRFRVQKNEDSPAFIIGGSSHSLISNSVIFVSSNHSNHSTLATPSPRIPFDPSKNLSRNSHLPSFASEIKKIRLPSKPAKSDPLNNHMLDLMSHPAFRQPMFTKLKPKIMSGNPITGISITPDPSRVLAKSGARMLTDQKPYLYKQ